MSFINCKTLVYQILIDKPHTRDCDYYLYNQVLKHFNAQHITALDLMKKMKEGLIFNFETVSRARRLLQQENEFLRGANYVLRQTKLQDIRKSEINGYSN
jgi:hypothetical protein